MGESEMGWIKNGLRDGPKSGQKINISLALRVNLHKLDQESRSEAQPQNRVGLIPGSWGKTKISLGHPTAGLDVRLRGDWSWVPPSPRKGGSETSTLVEENPLAH